jgi:hypothetical protein
VGFEASRSSWLSILSLFVAVSDEVEEEESSSFEENQGA